MRWRVCCATAGLCVHPEDGARVRPAGLAREARAARHVDQAGHVDPAGGAEDLPDQRAPRELRLPDRGPAGRGDVPEPRRGGGQGKRLHDLRGEAVRAAQRAGPRRRAAAPRRHRRVLRHAEPPARRHRPGQVPQQHARHLPLQRGATHAPAAHSAHTRYAYTRNRRTHAPRARIVGRRTRMRSAA